jgi:surface polysaccharide O-acyltransferase-like enzyme
MNIKLQPGLLQRSNTIDILRLLASFCIIVLHINFGQAHEDVYGNIKLLCRWAVPFFFLIGGFFLQRSMERSVSEAFKSTFSKISIIYLIASVVFLPFSYLSYGPLKMKYILAGDYFHLWYLPSMLIGVIVLYLYHKLKVNTLIKIITIFTITAAFLMTDPYSYLINISPKALPTRPLWSIPLMLTGSLFFSNASFKTLLKPRLGIVFILIGAALQVAEVIHIDQITNRSIYDHQFLMGTFPFSVGIFILSLTLKWNLEWLGELGKCYSLFIYLYHPVLIFSLHLIDYEVTLKNVVYLLPILIFFIVLFSGILLEKYCKRIFLTLNGSLTSAPGRTRTKIAA